MGRVSKDKLLRDVRVIIAENEHLDPLIENDDQMALERDTLLETLIAVAIDKIHTIAPVDMLSDINKRAEKLKWKETEIGTRIAELPEDFLRITYVKGRNWKKGVIYIVSEESAVYERFSSPVKGVKPNVYYPAAAIVRSSFEEDPSKAGRFIEICPSDNDVIVSYINKSIEYDDDGENGSISPDNGYDIASECYWCVVYTIANMYFVSVNDNARAEMMAAEAANIIQGRMNRLNAS